MKDGDKEDGAKEDGAKEDISKNMNEKYDSFRIKTEERIEKLIKQFEDKFINNNNENNKNGIHIYIH